jgi:hypothetical protein
VIGSGRAHAGDCPPSSPECYLAAGKQLLSTDPRRAAEALLASFQLDERTDTLALYASALELDKKPAHALETWKRVVVFRDGELEAAKQTARTAKGRKAAAARDAVARAERKSEQAAAAILRLWSTVGRVKIRFAPGAQFAVSRDGVEVDATREVAVASPRDELVFARRDGSVERVVVEVGAGQTAQIDAPEPIARPRVEPPPKPVPPAPKPEPAPEPAKPEPAVEPAAEEPTESITATSRTDDRRSPTLVRVGLGVAAAGVVLGGIAAGFGFNASRDFDRAQELGCSGDGACPAGKAADLAERSNDRARIAQLTVIGGGALVATGAVLWFYGRKKQHREVAVQVGPSSAAIAWRF